MKALYIGLIAGVLACSGCSPEKVSPEGDYASLVGAAGCKAIQTNSNHPTDPVDLSVLRQKGSCLELDVWYAGGCQNHQFWLSWDGSIQKSLPPQVNLILHHDSHADQCEALIGNTLSYSTKKIELEGYREVMVNIISPNGDQNSILFSY